MRAITFRTTGGPEVLEMADVADPVAAKGSVVIAVRAIGVNFADTHFRRGEYFVKPRLPDIPGMEAAGEVIAVGEGVPSVSVGQRVMAVGRAAYAERMVAHARHVYPMPEGLSFEDAAALPVQGLTAKHVLSMQGRLERGESVLVHAAAGGVGVFAIQLARRMGARFVVGTASTADKQALARSLGADACFAPTADFPQRVKEATEGAGVDVVLEMAGGTDAYKRDLACLKPFGRMVVYGAASGELRGTFEPVGLMGRNLSVSGYYLTSVLEDRERCAPELATLADWVVDGSLRVVRASTLPLASAAEAHRLLEARATVGKVVLVP